ncbi:MAG TPA: hypothetical protein VFP84_21805 [Kofleriaceae bacterium]|nr:hypothetical protein [Kofleriaceae bacterium]
MTWLHIVVVGASSIAAMRAALERGDVDEAARQGANAGPAVVERALASSDRTTQLAAIAAAPLVEDRGELLLALARLAGGPDRRTALPAGDAARTIARERAHRAAAGQRADDLADADLASFRAAWAAIAMRGDRWIELRLRALDTAAALDPDGTGVDLAAALHDPDPAFRRAAATIVALPAPPATFAALADAVVNDTDPDVALGAAQSLCMSFDLAAPATARPVLDALGEPGLARLRAVVPSHRPDVAAARDAARCLTADGTPASIAAARTIPAAPPAHVPAPPPTTSPTASPPAGTDTPGADAAPPPTLPAKRRGPRTRRGAAH